MKKKLLELGNNLVEMLSLNLLEVTNFYRDVPRFASSKFS
jgi:hypothetical protein